MDRGKRLGKLGLSNNKIYMDLKDVIREHALQFLPAKSLSRFQSVCRDWKLQISTPFFAHNQSLACHSIVGLFCQKHGALPMLISFDKASCGVPDPCLRFLPDAVDIRSSSNGLLLCQARSGDKAYYVCNPVTQQWKKLPQPNADHGPDPAVVLIFEPSLLNFEADYKIVCAFQSVDFDDATEFEIYSSKEGSWKISGEICFAARSPMPRSGVHVDGCIYWAGKQGGILAYDMTKNRFLLLQDYYISYSTGTLGDINGKLCSAHVTGRSIILNVLVNMHSNTMQMNCRSRMWEEKHRITLDSEVVGGDASALAVLFVGGGMLVASGGARLYLHNLKTKETKALNSSADHYNMRCVPYVNSLVCI